MQQSNAPAKLVLPFANSGAKNDIPVASQIGVTAGAASLTDGFPPLTRTPLAAGGVPPSGLDMNGILYEVSALLRWLNAGGGFAFDSVFAADANVDGYPKGARLLRSDGSGYWLNTIDGNKTDPESVTVGQAALAGWVPDTTNGVAAVSMTSANVTLTPLQYGKPVIVLSGALTANLNLIFPDMRGQWTVVNNCTGDFTVTAKTANGTGVTIKTSRTRIIWGDGTNIYNAVNETDTLPQFDNSTGFASTAFVKRRGVEKSGVQIVTAAATLSAANAGGSVILSAAAAFTVTLPPAANFPAGGRIEFLNVNAGAATVAANGTETIDTGTATPASIVLGRGDTLVLERSDVNNKWFAVSGTAKLPSSDVYKRFKNVEPKVQGVGVAGNTANTTTNNQVSITAPCAGYVLAHAMLNVSTQAAHGVAFELVIDGINVSGDNTLLPMGHHHHKIVSAGQTVTVNARTVTGATAPGNSMSSRVFATFIPNPQ